MITIEKCKAILAREGFKCAVQSYWYNNDMFALESGGSLFIIPDFNYDEREKRWCTYSNKKAPYFELTNKFIDCKGTEEELMILINAFKKNQKQARIEDKKRNISKDFQGE
jgi:hypothetical protein